MSIQQPLEGHRSATSKKKTQYRIFNRSRFHHKTQSISASSACDLLRPQPPTKFPISKKLHATSFNKVVVSFQLRRLEKKRWKETTHNSLYLFKNLKIYESTKSPITPISTPRLFQHKPIKKRHNPTRSHPPTPENITSQWTPQKAQISAHKFQTTLT